MDVRLAKLIADYQHNVREILKLFAAHNISRPASSQEWLDYSLEPQDALGNGITYFKHGVGISVNLPAGKVDFDFGRNGEFDGFDAWRLEIFAGQRLANYGFVDVADLKRAFSDAVKNDSITRATGTMFYIVEIATAMRDVRKYFQNKELPHKSRDGVMTLYSSCFLSAEIMLEEYKKLKFDLSKWETSPKKAARYRTYLLSWLAYLRSTCEGLETLGGRQLFVHSRPNDFLESVALLDEIVRIQKPHKDSLRRLRNDIFHLRGSNESLNEFFSDSNERLEWAKSLHNALKAFFSEYRISCELYYMNHGRKKECLAFKTKFYK